MTIAIEPLDRFDLSQRGSRCGGPRHRNRPASTLGILFDTFHANIEEKDVAAGYSTVGRHLKNMSTRQEAVRGIPGSGHVEWDRVFRSLAGLALRRLAHDRKFHQEADRDGEDERVSDFQLSRVGIRGARGRRCRHTVVATARAGDCRLPRLLQHAHGGQEEAERVGLCKTCSQRLGVGAGNNEKIFADPVPPTSGAQPVLKRGGFLADVKNAIPATHAAGPGSGLDSVSALYETRGRWIGP